MNLSNTNMRFFPSFGLDFIRNCAILFVISVHFFLHTPFDETYPVGFSLFVQACAQFFFNMAIPLFLLLTGYLNGEKTVSASYYKKAIHVLGSYLLFSFVVILFREYYLGEEKTLYQWVGQILRFSAIPYGWYIEMWIGLFLLTPFLNILYQNIPNQKQKIILILTFCSLTAIPDLLNRYGFHLVPGFWVASYPLTFYFLGSYINEYKPRPNKWAMIAIIILICLINPVFTLFTNHKTLIHIAGGPAGVFVTVTAVFFFLLFYQMKCNKVFVTKAVSRISKLSLDMYLCCYIFDALFYPLFMKRYFENQAQFGVYFFVLVPILFSCSFATAWLKQKILPKL